MEKIYIAQILNAENNEVLVKVSAGSLESLEEEMGKQKWLKFAEDRPEVFMPEVEDESQLEPVLPEDNNISNSEETLPDDLGTEEGR